MLVLAGVGVLSAPALVAARIAAALPALRAGGGAKPIVAGHELAGSMRRHTGLRRSVPVISARGSLFASQALRETAAVSTDVAAVVADGVLATPGLVAAPDAIVVVAVVADVLVLRDVWQALRIYKLADVMARCAQLLSVAP